MKTNKNGVKLLAAIMAFAMVFVAGVVFIGDSSESDAAEAPITNSINEAPTSFTGTVSTGNYKVTKDATLSLDSASDVDINIYLVSGKTLTVTGSTNNAVDIVVYPAKADGSYYEAANCITINDLKATTVKIGSFYDESTSTDSYVTISGDATGATITATASGVKVGSETLTVTTSAITNLVYGIEVMKDGATDIYTYHPTGANITVSVAENDTVKVVNGSAIVSQGDNVIKLSKVKSSAASNTITVTGAGEGAYPTIGGTATSGSESISVSGGIFKDNSLDAAFTNVVKATASGPAYYYLNQIPAGNSIDGSISATGFTIQGTVTQKANATLTSTVDITLTAGSSLVINEGVAVSSEEDLAGVGTTGKVRVFGSLTVGETTLTGSSTIYVGPNGSVSGVTTATMGYVSNTNVTSGSDYEIQGIPSSKDVGDAVLKGTLTIPQGTTFTVNGNLGLNGQKLVIEGTLIISKNAKVFGTGHATNGIELASTGKIQNEGMVGSMMPVLVSNGGAQKVTLTGVSGAEFSYKKIDGTSTLCVTGDIKKIRNATTSTITISGAAISGEMTISKDVTLSGDTTTTGAIVAANATVIINGKLTSANTNALTLKEGATVIINGILDESKAIIAEVGSYNSETNVFTAGASGAIFTATTDATYANTPSGFTIYTKRVAITNADDTVSYFRYAYINGQIISSKATAGDTEAEVLDITGADVRIAQGESLIVKKGSSLTTSSTPKIIVEGSLTFEAGSVAPSIKYFGAYYTVTPENTTDTATYFMPLSEAMKAIATADDMTVTAKVGDIDFDITVGKDQVLNLTMAEDSKILDDAVVTVEDDGAITGTIPEVLGTLIVKPEGSCNAPTTYASKKVSTDGTVTYAGFTVAVSGAQPGDIINIDSADVGSETKSKDLNIPAGVKVVIADRLTVYGDLNIPEGAELVGGLIFVNGKTEDVSKVNVEGTLDVSAGSLGGSNNEVYSTGKAIFATKYSSMNGAYMTVSGNIVLTSVSNAVKYAIDNSISSVNVVGKVSDATDIDLKGKTLTIDSGSQVTLGNVTLDGGKIVSNGDLTATITAPSGKVDTTGATVDSTLKLVKSTVTVESKKVTNASGVTTYTFSFNAIDGEMTVMNGVVTIKDDISAATAKSKLTVASDAELQVIAGKTVIGGDLVQFTVDGTLTVKDEGEVEFSTVTATGKVPVINGTVAVEDGKVVIKALKLLGTITVSDTETVKGTLQVSDSGLVIGAPIESIGAAASITGPVKLDDGKYIKAYAGADLSGALINVPTGAESTVKTTDFFVNGVPYATVYAEGSVAVSGIISADEVSKIDGLVTVATLTWKNADGSTFTGTYIGDSDALYTSVDLSKADVKASVGSGISLWIDGVKYNSGSTAQLTVGEHQVKATVNPGYKGTVTVSFNGTTVTDGKITVTAAMVGGNNVLSATGDITIDSGDTPAPTPVQPTEKDDGMGITDYLLIVLVVLAAILVVIVAIRMMRS